MFVAVVAIAVVLSFVVGYVAGSASSHADSIDVTKLTKAEFIEYNLGRYYAINGVLYEKLEGMATRFDIQRDQENELRDIFSDWYDNGVIEPYTKD